MPHVEKAWLCSMQSPLRRTQHREMDGAPCWAGHWALCWTHAGCTQVGSVQSPRDLEEKGLQALKSIPRSDLTAHAIRTTHFTASKDFMSFWHCICRASFFPGLGARQPFVPSLPAPSTATQLLAPDWQRAQTTNARSLQAGPLEEWGTEVWVFPSQARATVCLQLVWYTFIRKTFKSTGDERTEQWTQMTPPQSHQLLTQSHKILCVCMCVVYKYWFCWTILIKLQTWHATPRYFSIHPWGHFPIL